MASTNRSPSNGSQPPPAYDAAVAQPSLASVHQQLVMTVRDQIITTCASVTVFVRIGPGPSRLYASRTGYAEPKLRRARGLLGLGHHYHRRVRLS